MPPSRDKPRLPLEGYELMAALPPSVAITSELV